MLQLTLLRLSKEDMDAYIAKKIEYKASKSKLATAKERSKALAKVRPHGYRYITGDAYPGYLQADDTRHVIEIVTFEKSDF